MGRRASLSELEDPEYIFIQADREVADILSLIGLPVNYCRYLLVVVGDAEYDEVWAVDSPYIYSVAEQIYCNGEVMADE